MLRDTGYQLITCATLSPARAAMQSLRASTVQFTEERQRKPYAWQNQGKCSLSNWHVFCSLEEPWSQPGHAAQGDGVRMLTDVYELHVAYKQLLDTIIVAYITVTTGPKFWQSSQGDARLRLSAFCNHVANINVTICACVCKSCLDVHSSTVRELLVKI